jgi:putative glycosyltransferase (TIGR04372 family)
MAPKFVKTAQYFYETAVAPFLAIYCRWLFLPIYWVFRMARIKLVWNITGGTGHTIFELDYFFHIREEAVRYLWVKKPDGFSEVGMKIYRKHFWKVRSSYVLYHLLLPIALSFEEIVVDAGLSRLKWQLKSRVWKEYRRLGGGLTYLHQLSKQEGQDVLSRYYAEKQKKGEYYPLLDGEFDEREIENFLRGRGGKLALVHLKEGIVNATAKPTDPETYLEALRFLLDKGYTLVFVGREKMPTCFRELSVLNYSESEIASFENDIALARRADMAIVGGSGIAFLPACLNKPYLYLNSWHTPRPLCGSRCIMIPSLVMRQDGSWLSLQEQSTLYKNLPDNGPEIFPQDIYEARNASSDEILEGVKELFGKINAPWTELQRKYRSLDPEGPLQFSEARCSHYFLEKHKALLA